jgi:hypothetical protein
MDMCRLATRATLSLQVNTNTRKSARSALLSAQSTSS